jgi:hypothetical protein
VNPTSVCTGSILHLPATYPGIEDVESSVIMCS